MVLSLLASALKVPPGNTKTDCAVCGESEFPTVGNVRRALGSAFNNHLVLAAPEVDAVCAGCKAVLGGRPGREPPPLRMRSIAVDVASREMRFLSQPDWWDILTNPHHPPVILSWAQSRKKQHQLYAGISAHGRWHVGSDTAPIIWNHAPDLVSAIERLREIGASKGSILAGRYRPQLVASHGSAIEIAEQVARRWRGSAALQLLVHAAPSDQPEDKPEDMPVALSKPDKRAVDVLAELAWGSSYRVENGMRFWDGYYLSRIARFGRLTLPDMVSRIISECGVGTHSAAKVAQQVADWSTEETDAVSDAIRRRSAILHGLAFDQMAQRRQAQKEARNGQVA